MRTTVVRVPRANELEVVDVDVPDPQPDEVVLRIAFGGICGSDLHYYQHGRNGAFVIEEPLILGHEISGVIEAIGPRAETALEVGDPVTVHPARPTPPPGGIEGRGLNLGDVRYLGSAATHPHTQGGFSRHLVVKPAQLRRLPEGLSLRTGALAEPLSIALHGVNMAARLDLTDIRILIAGSGPIGLLALVALRARGAQHITTTDLAEPPLALACSLGAESSVQVGSGVLAASSYHLVIEASGSPRSLASALDTVKPGGTIVQLGILPAGDLPLSIGRLQSKQVTLVGSQRFDVEMEEAVSILVAHPEVEQIISGVFDLAHVADAFALASAGDSSKVLIDFS